MTVPRRLALPVILGVALLANVAVILGTPDYRPLHDSADYVRHAVSIANGEGYPDSKITAEPSPTAFRPPLYPYALGAVFFVSGDSLTAGRLLNALFGVVIVLLIYLIARTFWDDRYALVAAGVAAVAPPLFLLSAALNTESLFLMIELGAVLLALHSRARDGDLRFAAAAGVCCGLAALTRTNGILLVIPICVAALVRRPRLSRAALTAPAAVLVAAALTVAPWAIRNSLTFDRPVGFSGQTGIALAGIYNEVAENHDGYRSSWVLPFLAPRYTPIYLRRDFDEAEVDSELRRRALDWAFERPGYVVQSTALNGLRMFEIIGDHPGLIEANRQQLGFGVNLARVERASFYLLALLALAGVLVIRRWPRERRIPVFVWLVPLVLLAAAAPILGSTRYRIPLYPFLPLAAAPALVAAADRLRLRRTVKATA